MSPERPRQHRVESKSRRAFEEALGDRFVVRDQTPDYAIDCEVEEFDTDGKATGVRFYAQLKATDEADIDDALRFPFSVDHLQYYASLALPVLLVRYHAPSGRLFARWAHGLSEPEAVDDDQQTVTVHWRPSDELTADSPAALVQGAKDFVELRRAALKRPVGAYLEMPDNWRGLSKAEMELVIDDVLREVPDLLKSDDAGPARLFLAEDRLGAHLSTVAGASVGVDEDYSAEGRADQVAADLMVLTALAFANLGQDDLCAQVAGRFLADADLTLTPDFVVPVTSALARNRRIIEAAEMCKRLDARGDDGAISTASVLSTIAIHHGRTMSDGERQVFEATLRDCIGRRQEAGEIVAQGRLEYNLGAFLRQARRPDEAREHYERALELDPGYEGRDYFWSEFAGTLFLSGNYRRSADAYGKALELGADRFDRARRADALMFSGEYAQARNEFRAHIADVGDVYKAGAEYGLKGIVLDHIVDDLGLEHQERNRDEAGRIAGRLAEAAPADPDSGAATCLEAIRADALSPLPWFNLGRCELDRGDNLAAARAYLAAALFREDDAEAWANAFMLFAGEGVLVVLGSIFVTADRMSSGGFLRQLTALAQEQGEGFDVDGFLDVVRGLMQDLPLEREGESGPLAMRFLGEDGSVERVEMD